MSKAHRPPTAKPADGVNGDSPAWLPSSERESAGDAAHRIARAIPHRVYRKAEEADAQQGEDEEKKEAEAEGTAEDTAEAKETGGEPGEKAAEGSESGDKAGEEPEKISAKLEGVARKIMLAPEGDDPLLKLAKKYDLNLQSPNSRQILENLGMTCEAFIGAYRKGSLKAEFPREYLALTVQAALDADKSKVRKLLTDGRFAK